MRIVIFWQSLFKEGGVDRNTRVAQCNTRCICRSTWIAQARSYCRLIKNEISHPMIHIYCSRVSRYERFLGITSPQFMCSKIRIQFANYLFFSCSFHECHATCMCMCMWLFVHICSCTMNAWFEPLLYRIQCQFCDETLGFSRSARDSFASGSRQRWCQLQCGQTDCSPTILPCKCCGGAARRAGV